MFSYTSDGTNDGGFRRTFLQCWHSECEDGSSYAKLLLKLLLYAEVTCNQNNWSVNLNNLTNETHSLKKMINHCEHSTIKSKAPGIFFKSEK